ncbi:indolethylamine N-methyltransferase-like [Ambystoma mexicanum]|uniref:indolethylamine N-methyltransferase-like n=1 Tax=Ambystoma mexicanum TaxID=8296 RepID=UPI0037E7DE11
MKMASNSAWMELYEKHLDSASAMAIYYTEDSSFVEDSIKQALKYLVTVFSSGAVKGDTLIQYGLNLATLFPACGCFKEIIFSEFLESHIQVVRKWVNKKPGAFDWSPSAKFVCELEGNRETWTEKEETLRRKMTQILKCKAKEGCLVLPSLPTQVDCILVIHFLEFLSPRVDVFRKTLTNMSSQLKIGGHLLLNVLLGCTFIMIGTFKFPLLCLDKECVSQALSDAGFVIKESQNNLRANNTQYSVIDFSSTLCLVACKERNV